MDTASTAASPKVVLGKLAVSTVILVFLGLQTVAAFSWYLAFASYRNGYLWPFLDYPMYHQAHDEGATIDRFVLIGLFADGREEQIDPEDLHLSSWKFLDGFVAAMERVDQAALAVYTGLCRRRYGPALMAVRMENHPLVLREGRARPGVPRVVGTIPMKEVQVQP